MIRTCINVGNEKCLQNYHQRNFMGIDSLEGIGIGESMVLN
jgi:hypothetical protein